jgi:hypothetical protein
MMVSTRDRDSDPQRAPWLAPGLADVPPVGAAGESALVDAARLLVKVAAGPGCMAGCGDNSLPRLARYWRMTSSVPARQNAAVQSSGPGPRSRSVRKSSVRLGLSAARLARQLATISRSGPGSPTRPAQCGRRGTR